tara:strand:+ start:6339 stop:7265 length:927 start_codon:yes stop_codon:yes gene_type:complete
MIFKFDKKTTLPRWRDFSGGLSLGVCLVTFIVLTIPQPARAQQLREQLEKIYRGSISAMAAKNYPAWKQYTAKSRRVHTHNLVISQKERWPDAMFNLPISQPEIGTLGHLETLTKGDTTHLIYYGKVDFGIAPEHEIPNNILLLRFVREEDGWKFDNTRFFNLAENPDIARKAELHDLSFLEDEAFQPTGIAPPVPRAARSPDYIGELWIAAVGYEVNVQLGDLHQATVRNNLATDVIVGGLWSEGREISLQITKLELEEEADRRLEIAVYAFPNGQKGKRVWYWKPKPGKVPETYRSKVWANAVTLR